MKINFELKKKGREIRSKAKSPLRASGSLGKIVLFPQISSIKKKVNVQLLTQPDTIKA